MNGITTQTTGEAASVVNPVDDIASLLIGEEDEQTGSEDQQLGLNEAGNSESDGQQEEGEDSSAEGDEDQDEQSDEDLTWAKALGVEDNQLVLDSKGNLKGIVVKVDGEVSTLPLKDVIAGYQINRHVTQKSQALAEEKREFDQLKAHAAQALTSKLEAAERLTQMLHNNLVSEYANVDWELLRVQNPGEYAAKVADFQAKNQGIQNALAAVGAEKNQLSMQQSQEYQQNFARYLDFQLQKVLEHNPAWRDQEVLRSNINEIGAIISKEYGITQDEFAMLNDYRHLEIIKDAIAYRKGKSVSKQKIQNIPNVQSSSGKSSKPMSKLTRLTLDARKAKGYKQRDLQRDAVAALLLGEK
jgi:hypothetical protein